MDRLDFYMKSTCGTCKKVKAYLERKKVPLRVIDIVRSPPPRQLIEKVIDRYGVRGSLNPRSVTYREKKLGEKPPSREEAIELMLRDPNLIRRPVIRKGRKVVAGFDEEGISELTK